MSSLLIYSCWMTDPCQTELGISTRRTTLLSPAVLWKHFPNHIDYCTTASSTALPLKNWTQVLVGIDLKKTEFHCSRFEFLLEVLHRLFAATHTEHGMRLPIDPLLK